MVTSLCTPVRVIGEAPMARGAALPRLRAARIDKLWTQKQLADASGVHVNTINRIEREGAPAELRTVQKLADALGVEAAELMRGEGS
jgi:transcriptional regulator with XRE-family HTH domain